MTETYDAKIFTVATLLGSHLVYNTVKVIDQQAVNLLGEQKAPHPIAQCCELYLEMLARRAQLFRVRSLAPSAVAEDHEKSVAEASAAEIPVFLSAKTFPPLTWYSLHKLLICIGFPL